MCHQTPAQKVKEGLRKAVREIFVFIGIAAVVSALFIVLLAQRENRTEVWWEVLVAGLFAGLWGGPVLWVVYRIIRFAIGPRS